ncbi:MAG: helix-turn-helix transcriptional regulator [Clostridia bacterium]|nr:helix-turn-helix transcriptional regulator [Clostridia bacterium]
MARLNERIKELRIQRGLNQVQFSKIMGVTKQCVSNWENDNVLPSIEMLERLSDFFETTTDFMLGRCQDNPIDTKGLTDTQVTHIKAIVEDLRLGNGHGK